MYPQTDKQTRPEPQLDDKTIRSLMPAIDIKALHITGAQVLIYHEDQNKKKDETTAGGIMLTDKTLEKAKMDKLTIGTIIKVGPQVQDPEIQVGKQALIYRHQSEGGLKGTDDTIYVLFNEYNIRGVLPAPKAIKAIKGEA
jgi:co-chaperonin GroES (HSP10)